jgi:DNA topoisomerase-1
VKKSKRGKVFYGCAAYPECDRVYWDKPVVEECPKCKAPFLLEKTTKKQGTFRHCANEDCDYNSSEDAVEKVKAKK